MLEKKLEILYIIYMTLTIKLKVDFWLQLHAMEQMNLEILAQTKTTQLNTLLVAMIEELMFPTSTSIKLVVLRKVQESIKLINH